MTTQFGGEDQLTYLYDYIQFGEQRHPSISAGTA